jgi:hypothetical protein
VGREEGLRSTTNDMAEPRREKHHNSVVAIVGSSGVTTDAAYREGTCSHAVLQTEYTIHRCTSVYSNEHPAVCCSRCSSNLSLPSYESFG